MPANLHRDPILHRASRPTGPPGAPQRRWPPCVPDVGGQPPKHKGTDHLRADLRAKVAKGLEELENATSAAAASLNPSWSAKKGRVKRR